MHKYDQRMISYDQAFKQVHEQLNRLKPKPKLLYVQLLGGERGCASAHALGSAKFELRMRSNWISTRMGNKSCATPYETVRPILTTDI